MKKQLIFIHGGETFNTYEEYVVFLKGFKIESLDYFKRNKWGTSLQDKLGQDFEVILPVMPNKLNAKYIEWKTYFEKVLELLDGEVILVGHSLGGIFLVKYLAENTLFRKIGGLFLVAAPFDDKNSEYFLVDFNLPNDLSNVATQVRSIYVYSSKDDPVVPYIDMEKYQKKLPNANFVTFENRGHFSQEDFPEIVKDIRNLK